MDIKQRCNELRAEILATEGRAQAVKRACAETPDLPGSADRGEMIANVTLAYRHLEDARMRFGKAIQALEGGVSVYDRMSGKVGSP